MSSSLITLDNANTIYTDIRTRLDSQKAELLERLSSLDNAKLDKVSNKTVIYGTDTEGSQTTYYLNDFVMEDELNSKVSEIVKSDSNLQTRLDNKLDKVSDKSVVYCTDDKAKQTQKSLSDFAMLSDVKTLLTKFADAGMPDYSTDRIDVPVTWNTNFAHQYTVEYDGWVELRLWIGGNGYAKISTNYTYNLWSERSNYGNDTDQYVALYIPVTEGDVVNINGNLGTYNTDSHSTQSKLCYLIKSKKYRYLEELNK